MKMAAIIVVLLAVSAAAILNLPQFGGYFRGARLQRMHRSPEWIGGRFQNVPRQHGIPLLESLRLYRKGQVREPRFPIPVIDLPAASLAMPPGAGLRAVWFGHSSVLVEIDGVRMMTDPVFAEVVSPVPRIGPVRFHRAPVPLSAMSGIDAVVISHDHYDHLDMHAVQHLGSRGTHFFVPLGIGAHLERWGIPRAQIHEMDWWESASFRGLTIHCTPARHYSGRRRMSNPTLWSSWMIRGPQHSIYYSGDTGYSPQFAAIRSRFGAPDLALLKVGAYGDTWLDIQMDPESAMRAATDLHARTVLPVHWATFNLSYHDWDEPILRSVAAAERNHLHVITPRIGEVFTYGQPFTNVPWYAAQQARRRE